MRRSPILDVVARAEFHVLLVLSLYLLFAGHNQPGGGFSGGLVAGAAFGLRYVSGGTDAVESAARLRPTTLLGLGLLLAVGTAVVPLVLGHDLLDHAPLEWRLPVLGRLKATSALPFDAGVYLVVVGMVLLVLTTLGRQDRP